MIKARQWGKGIHHWVETGEVTDTVEGETVKWLGPALKKKLDTSGVQRGDWYGVGRHEAKVVLAGDDLTLASYVVIPEGTPENRRMYVPYPKDPKSVRITADFIGEHKGDPHVDDLKTGAYYDRKTNRTNPPAPSSPQVAVAALAVSDIVGGSNGGVGVWGSITHWPRYPLAGHPNREWHWYAPQTLDNLRKVLRVVRDNATSGAPDVRPGDHCKFCRCKPTCPAHVF